MVFIRYTLHPIFEGPRLSRERSPRPTKATSSKMARPTRAKAAEAWGGSSVFYYMLEKRPPTRNCPSISPTAWSPNFKQFKWARLAEKGHKHVGGLCAPVRRGGPAPWGRLDCVLFLLGDPAATTGFGAPGPGNALRDLGAGGWALAIKNRGRRPDIAKTFGPGVYLGRDAAEQVLRGHEFRRGGWPSASTRCCGFSDLRGSTAISEEASIPARINPSFLNDLCAGLDSTAIP